MHAMVLVGEYIIALSHNKAPKWPLSTAYCELPATRVVDLGEIANRNFLLVHGESCRSIRLS